MIRLALLPIGLKILWLHKTRRELRPNRVVCSSMNLANHVSQKETRNAQKREKRDRVQWSEYSGIRNSLDMLGC